MLELYCLWLVESPSARVEEGVRVGQGTVGDGMGRERVEVWWGRGCRPVQRSNSSTAYKEERGGREAWWFRGPRSHQGPPSTPQESCLTLSPKSRGKVDFTNPRKRTISWPMPSFQALSQSCLLSSLTSCPLLD